MRNAEHSKVFFTYVQDGPRCEQREVSSHSGSGLKSNALKGPDTALWRTYLLLVLSQKRLKVTTMHFRSQKRYDVQDFHSVNFRTELLQEDITTQEYEPFCPMFDHSSACRRRVQIDYTVMSPGFVDSNVR